MTPTGVTGTGVRPAVAGAVLVIGALSLIGCDSSAPPDSPGTPQRTVASVSSPTPGRTPELGATSTPSPTPKSSPTPKPNSTPDSAASKPSQASTPSRTPDPRNRFYTDDKTWYASPWFSGRHRIMVEYGCTPAPYYAPDPRCADDRGFHHGVDIAMPCGTEITAGLRGRVIAPGGPGTPGPAYGRTAFRIRTPAGQDVLIGHARTVFVRPGDQVRRGQPIALAGARGAPDGCHLHLEVRPAGGGVADAVNPTRIARLRP